MKNNIETVVAIETNAGEGTPKNRTQGSHLKMMISLSLLVALGVALKRFLGINTALLSISFGFVPVAIAGMLYGIPGGFAVGALADLVGALLFPFGAFNPVFTISAGISGLVYGAFLNKEKVSLLRIILCQLIISLVLHTALNTAIIALMYNKVFWVILHSRVIKNVTMFPLEVAIIYLFIDLRPQLRKIVK